MLVTLGITRYQSYPAMFHRISHGTTRALVPYGAMQLVPHRTTLSLVPHCSMRLLAPNNTMLLLVPRRIMLLLAS